MEEILVWIYRSIQGFVENSPEVNIEGSLNRLKANVGIVIQQLGGEADLSAAFNELCSPELLLRAARWVYIDDNMPGLIFNLPDGVEIAERLEDIVNHNFNRQTEKFITK